MSEESEERPIVLKVAPGVVDFGELAILLKQYRARLRAAGFLPSEVARMVALAHDRILAHVFPS